MKTILVILLTVTHLSGYLWAEKMDWIAVKVEGTGFDNTFEIEDTVAGTSKVLFLKAHEIQILTIKSSGVLDDGYGEIKYRIKGNIVWTRKSLIRNGEGPVTLN